MKRLLTAGMVLALIAASAQAGINWTGSTSSDWSTAANWDTGTVPAGSGDQAVIPSGTSECVYDEADGSQEIRQLYVNGNFSMSGGDLTAVSYQLRMGVGSGAGAGVFNLSGGTYTDKYAQIGLDSGNDGCELNISGGTMRLAATGSNYLGMNLGNNSSASVTVSGGLLSTRGGVTMGTGSGTGLFSVQGGDGAITIGDVDAGTANGYWTQNAGSTLQGLVGTDGQLSSIYINGVGGGLQTVTFENGALLDVGFLGDDVTGTWTLMEWESHSTVVDNGLAFAAGVDTDIWSFNIDETNRTLTVTAIPEPATLGLLGIAGAGLIVVRRRLKM